MNRAKRLILLSVSAFMFAIPLLGGSQVHAEMDMNHSQMSASANDCISQCASNNQVSPASGILNLKDKEKEKKREPFPIPPHWQFIQPVSLTALYLLLPIVFLLLYSKDPMLLRSTQLRF